MHKILIVAQNEAKANEAAAHFTSYQVKKVFPGTHSYSRHFDAIVIYLHEAKEVNFIKDILTKYQDSPIKAFLTKETFEDADQFKSRSFLDTDVSGLITYISTQHDQLK